MGMNVENINSPSNGISLDSAAHTAFGKFLVVFKPTVSLKKIIMTAFFYLLIRKYMCNKGNQKCLYQNDLSKMPFYHQKSDAF